MNRRLRRLARRVKRQAHRAQVSNEEWLAVMDVVHSPAKLVILQAKIDAARLNPYDGPANLYGMDWKELWNNIWDWFKANWPAILKFIITIAPLLLEPEQHEDS